MQRINFIEFDFKECMNIGCPGHYKEVSQGRYQCDQFSHHTAWLHTPMIFTYKTSDGCCNTLLNEYRAGRSKKRGTLTNKDLNTPPAPLKIDPMPPDEVKTDPDLVVLFELNNEQGTDHIPPRPMTPLSKQEAIPEVICMPIEGKHFDPALQDAIQQLVKSQPALKVQVVDIQPDQELCIYCGANLKKRSDLMWECYSDPGHTFWPHDGLAFWGHRYDRGQVKTVEVPVWAGGKTAAVTKTGQLSLFDLL